MQNGGVCLKKYEKNINNVYLLGKRCEMCYICNAEMENGSN